MEKDYNMFNIQGQFFCELINIIKLEYILANQKYYDDFFTAERNKLKIKFSEQKYKYDIFALIRKIIANSIKIDNSEYGYILVSYKKGNGTEYGRWYANKSIGLQSVLGYIRHTVCDDKWMDLDQVNSHPVILQQLFKKHKLKSQKLNNLISNREDFLKSIMDELKITRSEAKTIIIAVINGGSTYKSTIAKDFKDEVFKNIEIICQLPEYNDILEETVIKSKDTNSKNSYGKCISKILQIIENNLLEHYVQFFVDRNYIPKVNINGKEYYHTSLIFDGLQIPYHPDIVSNDKILKECQEYAFNHTGYNIDLIIKPFDNALELPNDYADVLDDIPAIINNLRTGLEHFKNKNRKIIDEAINSLTHYDVAVIFGIMLKGKVYCEDKDNWYYCNSKNIWKYNNSPVILDAIIPVIGYELLQLISKEYCSKAMDNTLDKEERDKWLKKAEKVEKLMNNMKLTPFRNNVVKNISLYIKEDFNEKFLDSKTHLFAFSNKVFDFSLNPDKKREDRTIKDFIRYIKPDDYISTNTGYPFPEQCDVVYTDKLNVYLNLLFPKDRVDNDNYKIDLDKKDYVLNIVATSLNGANNEQSVYFHTGKGSNSKTTFFSMIEKICGDYFIELGSSSFTDLPKANSVNELYKLKGKRFTTFAEPNDKDGTQLQVSTLKCFGDSDSVKLKGNQKYKNPIQFVNQSTLQGCMNKKPILSGVDGGVSRRIKIIEWHTQFLCPINLKRYLEEPFEKPKDPLFMKEVKTDDMRDAFLMMLLNQWINKVKNIPEIIVPDCVFKASQEYCDDCDLVKQFMNDTYDITGESTDYDKSSAIYAKYKSYIKNCHTDQPLSDKKFKESMCDIRGITFKRMTKGCFYFGIKEKSEETTKPPEPVQGPVKDPDVEFKSDTDDINDTRCESPEPSKP